MVSKVFVFLILGLCLGTGLIVAGCTQSSTQASVTTTTPAAQVSPAGQAGMANPASVNCGNIGGKVEIKDSAAGQYGMCTFTNGTTCEEWALFRGEGCKAANVTA
jgi:putative hemolysin